MAEFTENYNLKKPDQTDFYNIDDFNNNMDIIDTKLFEAMEAGQLETTVTEIKEITEEIKTSLGNAVDENIVPTIFGKLNNIINILSNISPNVIKNIQSGQYEILSTGDYSSFKPIPISEVNLSKTLFLYNDTSFMYYESTSGFDTPFKYYEVFHGNITPDITLETNQIKVEVPSIVSFGTSSELRRRYHVRFNWQLIEFY